MFPCPPEYHFAKLFVGIKCEQIEHDLNIKYLDEDATAKEITCFLQQNNILKKFKDKPQWIMDAGVYDEVIKVLRCAKDQGIKLEMTADEYVELLRKKLRKHTFVE